MLQKKKWIKTGKNQDLSQAARKKLKQIYRDSKTKTKRSKINKINEEAEKPDYLRDSNNHGDSWVTKKVKNYLKQSFLEKGNHSFLLLDCFKI